MKKFITVVTLVLILTFSCTCFVQAATKFKDVTGTRYEVAVDKLTTLGIINGFPDETFKPGESVTRAQLAKMLVEGLKMKNVTSTAVTKFSDVTTSHWAYNYIKTAVDNKLILGYPDGTFGPEKNVTYAEAMTMMLRALKLEDSMTDKTWPTGYMNEASKVGLLNSVSYSNATGPATRGETAISLYNMVNKIEDDELQKQIDAQKEQREAEKKAYDFGIVSSATESNGSYIIKFTGDKTKYELTSLSGSSKITSTKAKTVVDNIAAYKEDKGEIAIETYYTSTDLDKAKIVSKVSSNIVTFSDKTTLDLSSAADTSKFNLYTMVLVTAEYDEDDGTIEFTKVEKLGLGLDKVKFVKAYRLVIDNTNNVILIVKGFSVSDTIKKGVVTNAEYDTSDYKYGYVTSYSSKKATVKIDKTTYSVYSKSKDFTTDTIAIYTIDEDNLVSLVKAYGVENLDSSAKIISTVSGSKAGSQKVTYKNTSTAVDYYSSTNAKKYKDYYVVILDVGVDKKTGELYVEDHDAQNSLDTVKFYKGDRVIIDDKTKVFLIFSGLSSTDTVKSGVLQAATTTPSGDTNNTVKSFKLSGDTIVFYETSDKGKTLKSLKTFTTSDIKTKNTVTSAGTDTVTFSAGVGLGSVKKTSTAYFVVLVSAEIDGDNHVLFDQILSDVNTPTLANVSLAKDDLVIYDSTNKTIVCVRLPEGYSLEDLNDGGTVKPDITRGFYLINSIAESNQEIKINLVDTNGKSTTMTLVNSSVLPSELEDKDFLAEVPTFVYVEQNSDGLVSNIQEISSGKTFDSYKVNPYTSSTNVSKAKTLLVEPIFEGAKVSNLNIKSGTGSTLLSNIRGGFAILEGSTVKYVLVYKVEKPEKEGTYAGLVSSVDDNTITIEKEEYIVDIGNPVAGTIVLYKELCDDSIKIIKSYTIAEITKANRVSEVKDSLVSFDGVDYKDLTKQYSDYTLITAKITSGENAKITSAVMEDLVSKGVTVEKENYILADSTNNILIIAGE